MQYTLLQTPDIINVPKFIYLDADLIVCSDLAELFETDLADNYLAAVVDPWNPQLKDDWPHENPPAGSYFNSGVLIVNAEQWRTDGIGKQAIEATQRFNDQMKFFDQSALNYICHKRVHFLDSKWNTLASRIGAKTTELGVLHFAWWCKPWRDSWNNTAYPLWRTIYRRVTGRSRIDFLKFLCQTKLYKQLIAEYMARTPAQYWSYKYFIKSICWLQGKTKAETIELLKRFKATRTHQSSFAERKQMRQFYQQTFRGQLPSLSTTTEISTQSAPHAKAISSQ